MDKEELKHRAISMEDKLIITPFQGRRREVKLMRTDYEFRSYDLFELKQVDTNFYMKSAEEGFKLSLKAIFDESLGKFIFQASSFLSLIHI